jgi:hypothetical protein
MTSSMDKLKDDGWRFDVCPFGEHHDSVDPVDVDGKLTCPECPNHSWFLKKCARQTKQKFIPDIVKAYEAVKNKPALSWRILKENKCGAQEDKKSVFQEEGWELRKGKKPDDNWYELRHPKVVLQISYHDTVFYLGDYKHKCNDCGRCDGVCPKKRLKGRYPTPEFVKTTLFEEPVHTLKPVLDMKKRELDEGSLEPFEDEDGSIRCGEWMPGFQFGKKVRICKKKRDRCPHVVTIKSLALALDLPMGVGKSHAVREWLKRHANGKSVLMVSIRRALTTKWAQELTECGLKFDDYRNGYDSVRLICQLDSLYHVKRERYDVVIFDEIQTGLNRFPLVNSCATKCWRKLTEFMKNAKTAIVADADYSRFTESASWFMNTVLKKKPTLMQSSAEVDYRRYIRVQKGEDIARVALQVLLSGKTFVFGSTSREKVKDLQKELKETFTQMRAKAPNLGKPGIAIYADKAKKGLRDEEDTGHGFNEVMDGEPLEEHHYAQLPWILFSPSIGPGMSFDYPFDVVLMHAHPNHGSNVRFFSQMCNRVRSVNTGNVIYQIEPYHVKKPKPATYEAVFEALKDEGKYQDKMLKSYKLDFGAVESGTDFTKVVCYHEAEKQKSIARFEAIFRTFKEQDGGQFAVLQPGTAEAIGEFKREKNEKKAAKPKPNFKSVANAKILNKEEYKYLKGKESWINDMYKKGAAKGHRKYGGELPKILPEEQDAMDRYTWCKDFGLDPDGPTDVLEKFFLENCQSNQHCSKSKPLYETLSFLTMCNIEKAAKAEIKQRLKKPGEAMYKGRLKLHCLKDAVKIDVLKLLGFETVFSTECYRENQGDWKKIKWKKLTNYMNKNNFAKAVFKCKRAIEWNKPTEDDAWTLATMFLNAIGKNLGITSDRKHIIMGGTKPNRWWSLTHEWKGTGMEGVWHQRESISGLYERVLMVGNVKAPADFEALKLKLIPNITAWKWQSISKFKHGGASSASSIIAAFISLVSSGVASGAVGSEDVALVESLESEESSEEEETSSEDEEEAEQERKAAAKCKCPQPKKKRDAKRQSQSPSGVASGRSSKTSKKAAAAAEAEQKRKAANAAKCKGTQVTPNLMHAKWYDPKDFKNKMPFKETYVSKKEDGHRKYWPGTGNVLYSWRNNIKATKAMPAKWVEQMPKSALEMEVVVDNKLDDRKRSKVAEFDRGYIHDGQWDKLHFCIIDLPESKKVYSERRKELEALKLPEFMSLVKSYGVVKRVKRLKKILKEGQKSDKWFEGLMLNDGDKPYQGRNVKRDSDYILKYKPYQDFEALILERSGDKRNGFLCIDPLGREFSVGHCAKDSNLPHPLKFVENREVAIQDMEGRVVTVLHQGEKATEKDETKFADYENAAVKEYDGSMTWPQLCKKGLPTNGVRSWRTIAERETHSEPVKRKAGSTQPKKKRAKKKRQRSPTPSGTPSTERKAKKHKTDEAGSSGVFGIVKKFFGY